MDAPWNSCWLHKPLFSPRIDNSTWLTIALQKCSKCLTKVSLSAFRQRKDRLQIATVGSTNKNKENGITSFQNWRWTAVRDLDVFRSSRLPVPYQFKPNQPSEDFSVSCLDESHSTIPISKQWRYGKKRRLDVINLMLNIFRQCKLYIMQARHPFAEIKPIYEESKHLGIRNKGIPTTLQHYLHRITERGRWSKNKLFNIEDHTFLQVLHIGNTHAVTISTHWTLCSESSKGHQEHDHMLELMPRPFAAHGSRHCRCLRMPACVSYRTGRGTHSDFQMSSPAREIQQPMVHRFIHI